MPAQSSNDPLSPTPYQPQPMPDQPPAPQPAIPLPSPFQGQPGFQFQGHGNISHTGAVAGMLDNIMRGYVNGKAMGEAKKSLQLKKKSDDLNASYTADATRLWTVAQKQIAEGGKIDPNSDDYKQAQAAVNGSWGALQDFRGSLLDDGKKKKASKNGKERTPAEVLSDPKSTPQEKAAALHGMSQKLGAPIMGQIQNYAAQAQARAQRPEVQSQDIRAKAGLELDQLRTQKEPLTEQQQARAKQLEEYLTPKPKESGTTRLYESPDKSERKWLVPGQEPDNWNAVETTHPVAGPKLGTLGGAMQAYAEENHLDPAKMPLEAQNYVRELWAWEGRGDTASTTTTLKQNADNQWVPVTETNAHTKGPKPAPPRGMKAFDLGDAPPPATPEPGSYPLTITQSLIGKEIPGLVQPGNIDLRTRPNIKNPDGTHSSVFSMSSEIDGKEVMYPGVGDGKTYPARQLTQAEALDQYKKTGNNLGTFKNAASADAYARWLHQDQEKFGNNGAKGAPSKPTGGAPTTTPSGSTGGRSGHTSVGTPLMGAPDSSLTKMEQDAAAKKTQYAIASRAFMHLTPAGSNDILMAYTRSQIQGAGRLNDTEIKRNLAAGTYGERLSSMYSQFTKGELNITMLRNMVHEMGAAAEETQKAVAEERARREAGTVAGGGASPNNLPARPKDVPANYVYFLASDGNGHWVDPKNLDAAKKIDPKLQVIQ